MNRLQIIDLVRSFSIFAVLAVHLPASTIALHPDSNFSDKLWLILSRNGPYGVSLFFVISGFLITRTIFLRENQLSSLNLKKFYTRRIGRIIPLFFVIILIGIIVLLINPQSLPQFSACFREPKAKFDFLFWLSLFTFSFNWLRIHREPMAFGFGLHWDIFWSLAIEEQFYLFYPLILKRLGRIQNVIPFLIGVIIFGLISRWLVYLIAPDNWLASFTNSFSGFDLIAIGSLLYLTSEHLKPFLLRHKNLNKLICLIGLLTVLIVYKSLSLGDSVYRIYSPSLLGIGLFLFLLGGLNIEFFESPYLGWLVVPGKLSYGMYLLHPSVLFILWPLVTKMNRFLSFFIFMLVTVLVATVFYKFIERPANQFIRRRFGGM